MRVGLDGIVDPRAFQAAGQRHVMGAHLVDVEHQRRPLESILVQEGRDLVTRLRAQREGGVGKGSEARLGGAPMRSSFHRRSP